jgi:hypothetical protein
MCTFLFRAFDSGSRKAVLRSLWPLSTTSGVRGCRSVCQHRMPHWVVRATQHTDRRNATGLHVCEHPFVSPGVLLSMVIPLPCQPTVTGSDIIWVHAQLGQARVGPLRQIWPALWHATLRKHMVPCGLSVCTASCSECPLASSCCSVHGKSVLLHMCHRQCILNAMLVHLFATRPRITPGQAHCLLSSTCCILILGPGAPRRAHHPIAATTASRLFALSTQAHTRILLSSLRCRRSPTAWSAPNHSSVCVPERAAAQDMSW